MCTEDGVSAGVALSTDGSEAGLKGFCDGRDRAVKRRERPVARESELLEQAVDRIQLEPNHPKATMSPPQSPYRCQPEPPRGI